MFAESSTDASEGLDPQNQVAEVSKIRMFLKYVFNKHLWNTFNVQVSQH